MSGRVLSDEEIFTLELLEATLQEEGYRVKNRWDNFTDSSSALRVFPRRAQEERPILRSSFIVKVMWSRTSINDDATQDHDRMVAELQSERDILLEALKRIGNSDVFGEGTQTRIAIDALAKVKDSEA